MKLLALLLATLILGCAQPPILPPVTSVPSVKSADGAIPADLDVVVRLDLEAMRRSLGDGATTLALQGLSGDRGSELAPLYVNTDTVWIGFRPGEGLEPLDSVIVLEGHFDSFEPRTGRGREVWLAPRDLGGGWRRWERREPGTRSDWALLYQRLNKSVVAASIAEVDSTVRAVENRTTDSRVRAPQRGVAAVAVRLGPWVEALGGSRLRWLAQASTAHAYLEVVGAEIIVELDLSFATEEEALRGRDASLLLRELLGGQLEAYRAALERISASAVGNHLVFRYRGPSDWEGGPAFPLPPQGAAGADSAPDDHE